MTITMDDRDESGFISYEECQLMQARQELLALLADSEKDAEEGRTVPVKDTFNTLRYVIRTSNAEKNK